LPVFCLLHNEQANVNTDSMQTPQTHTFTVEASCWTKLVVVKQYCLNWSYTKDENRAL